VSLVDGAVAPLGRVVARHGLGGSVVPVMSAWFTRLRGGNSIFIGAGTQMCWCGGCGLQVDGLCGIAARARAALYRGSGHGRW
jgi:hypothetical protein